MATSAARSGLGGTPSSTNVCIRTKNACWCHEGEQGQDAVVLQFGWIGALRSCGCCHETSRANHTHRVLHSKDGRIRTALNQRQQGLCEAAQRGGTGGTDAWGIGSSVINTRAMQQQQQCVSRPRAHPCKASADPTPASMCPTHFCASSSAPILTAMAMGARRMGCSSETMVKFGAGNSTEESLQRATTGAAWGTSVRQAGRWVLRAARALLCCLRTPAAHTCCQKLHKKAGLLEVSVHVSGSHKRRRVCRTPLRRQGGQPAAYLLAIAHGTQNPPQAGTRMAGVQAAGAYTYATHLGCWALAPA